ncbi:hypothetical protein AVEN_126369-1 [Araneus ventricosus]|uniref:Uncharacterized protein n=1 Tax=Araneus ventricosus TaxID=182803 RepID=A0A4Y2FTV0_ARAVE|nr:hypothetical protein AVEN_126369-1 [Araneus ventricosus]
MLLFTSALMTALPAFNFVVMLPSFTSSHGVGFPMGDEYDISRIAKCGYLSTSTIFSLLDAQGASLFIIPFGACQNYHSHVFGQEVDCFVFTLETTVITAATIN